MGERTNSVVTHQLIQDWKARYSHLSFLVDDEMIVQCIAADALDCHPCDCRVLEPTAAEKYRGDFTVERISP